MADYATLLRDHVTLSCRSVDRIFLQAWRAETAVRAVCQFLYWQRGYAIPSSAAFGTIGDGYVAEAHRWAKANGIAVRRFVEGENKEAIARPLIEPPSMGAVTDAWCRSVSHRRRHRSWKAKGQEHAAHPHMEWGRQMAFVDHFHFCLWDPDWGGAFWKTNAWPRGRCEGSTATPERSGSAASSGSPIPRWTTVFATARIPWRCSGSVTGSARRCRINRTLPFSHAGRLVSQIRGTRKRYPGDRGIENGCTVVSAGRAVGPARGNDERRSE